MNMTKAQLEEKNRELREEVAELRRTCEELGSKDELEKRCTELEERNIELATEVTRLRDACRNYNKVNCKLSDEINALRRGKAEGKIIDVDYEVEE